MQVLHYLACSAPPRDGSIKDSRFILTAPARAGVSELVSYPLSLPQELPLRLACLADKGVTVIGGGREVPRCTGGALGGATAS